eukprot:7050202-Pyramimonas_sp.AAC.1
MRARHLPSLRLLCRNTRCSGMAKSMSRVLRHPTSLAPTPMPSIRQPCTVPPHARPRTTNAVLTINSVN